MNQSSWAIRDKDPIEPETHTHVAFTLTFIHPPVYTEKLRIMLSVVSCGKFHLHIWPECCGHCLALLHDGGLSPFLSGC